MSFLLRNVKSHKLLIGAPLLLFYLILVISPILYTATYSVLRTDSRTSNNERYEVKARKGDNVDNLKSHKLTLSGYENAMNDDEFWETVYESIIYTIICVFGQLVLGMISAYIIERAIYLKLNTYFLLIAFFIPYAVPTSIVVLMWNFLLLKDGIFAQFMAYFGVNPNIWKSDLLFYSLVFISIWEFFPFVFLAIYARMRKISNSIYQTSILDGASNLKIFRRITLPIIKSSLIVITLLRIAFMFSKFDLPLMFAENNANDKVRLAATFLVKNVASTEKMTNQFAKSMIVAFIVALIIMTIYFMFYVSTFINPAKWLKRLKTIFVK